MTSHTSGPWTVDADLMVVAEANPVPIADCGFVNRSDAENAANAQLCAAAPKMLVALLRLLPLASSWIHEGGRDPDLDFDIVEARAAIAKVTGP